MLVTTISCIYQLHKYQVKLPVILAHSPVNYTNIMLNYQLFLHTALQRENTLQTGFVVCNIGMLVFVCNNSMPTHRNFQS